MNESKLRSLFHKAIGDPEVPGYISSHARQAINRSQEGRGARNRSGFLALAAAVIAILVVAVLIAPRLSHGVPNPFNGPQPGNCTAVAGPAGAGPQPARVSAAMAYDPDTKQVVLFGGMVPGSSGSALADTWVWDGKIWSQRVVSVHPDVREEAAMAYDAIHHRLVLFGGIDTDGTPYNDTWTWDGAAWHPETPTINPPARNLASIAYDDALGKIVMFGGRNPIVGGSATLHDTWTWDGSNWTQIFTATVPSKRGSAVMDYDAKTRQLIMFGGDTGNSTNETWAFDGTNWSQLKFQAGAAVPRAREATVMARDDAAGTLVLFGGAELLDNGTATSGNDTWAWDGQAWTELNPSVSPPARGTETLVGNMVYDQALREDVLYGGTNDGSALGDTWTWDGGEWTQMSSTTSCR